MPVRNAQPYLEDCLNSIINQSINNWEVIAVNDHSTDQSSSVLQEYSFNDRRIQYKKNPGRGIIEALKFGYSMSSGNYITRMDADDLMPVYKLEKLKNTLNNSGRGHVATGKVKYITSTELGNGYKKYEDWLNKLCNTNSHYDEVYKECVIPSPCWMMFREDFDHIGGFDCPLYPEDYDLCFRMYTNNIRVASCLDILHVWRDHPERASRIDENYSDNSFLDLKVRYYLQKDHESDKELILWGAGKKGKRIAELLKENGIKFRWITDNIKKIGKHIYTIPLHHSRTLATKNKNLTANIIIAVANEGEQNEILNFIKVELSSSRYFMFC